MGEVIRVLSDYECHPLWLSGDQTYLNIPPGSLPISEELAGLLEQWAHEYDRTLDRDNPASSGFARPEDLRAFVQRGRELSVRLQSELGRSWRVVYFDQLSKRDVEVGGDPSRSPDSDRRGRAAST